MRQVEPISPPSESCLAEATLCFGPRLLRAARFLCRDEADAQDLVQETFSRALAAAASFRGESSPYTWLYAILRRLHFRLERRRRLAELWRPSGFIFSDEDSPEREVIRESLRERVDDALARMKVKHREILLLRYVEELKIAEIARLLGLPPGTVKSRLHHAVRGLQKSLPDDWSRIPLPAKE